jgi:hypothetical protein
MSLSQRLATPAGNEGVETVLHARVGAGVAVPKVACAVPEPERCVTVTGPDDPPQPAPVSATTRHVEAAAKVAMGPLRFAWQADVERPAAETRTLHRQDGRGPPGTHQDYLMRPSRVEPRHPLALDRRHSAGAESVE